MAEQQRITDIETFAKTFRLRIRHDEFGDPIIQGKGGQLYFDGPQLRLMAIDRKPAIVSRWESIGGHVWMGDISPNKSGARVQDVKVDDIPPTGYRTAMRMCGIRPIQILSPARQAALEKARAKAHEKLRQPLADDSGTP